jgi:hypothetical protein
VKNVKPNRFTVGIFGAVLATVLLAPQYASAVNELINGKVRVQAFSPSLVRLEVKGAKGFEDRTTHTVVSRKSTPTDLNVEKSDDLVKAFTKTYQVVMPADAESLEGIRILNADGELIYRFNRKDLEDHFLPTPSSLPKAWAMGDSPRMIPPEWGVTPAPQSHSEHPTSGWDLDNQADDLYVFIPGEGGYTQFREDFLELTGPVPMPPLYTFGFWYSRWYPYSEETVLARIDEFRENGYPLDVFVIDTDWREGGSHGYDINAKLYPDMKRCMAKVHEKNVRTMFNDHPSPAADSALDPEEVKYRYDGLTSLLDMGADVWWFDRNWWKTLHSPSEQMRHDAWGMRAYHDITKRFRPDTRPMIMSNVEGIKGGNNKFPSHPAAHRYPIWWTGDTLPEWRFLESGLTNAVESSLTRLMPYLGEDLGGFFYLPSTELYVRYLQYGALSPVTRIHCVLGHHRLPWKFGEEANSIMRNYVQMRYRLLPTFYAAARQAYEDGSPLLSRCDLFWPEYEESASNYQYLLSDDILVAPQYDYADRPRQLSGKHLLAITGKGAAAKMECFNNMDLEGDPVVTTNIWELGKMWWGDSPAEGLVEKDGFSARFTGTMKPLSEDGVYRFRAMLGLDGCRLKIDGKTVMENWSVDEKQREQLTQVDVPLKKGVPHKIVYEYRHKKGIANATLLAARYDSTKVCTRDLWLPPGDWVDVWTGETLSGPKTITVSSPLNHTPMYVKSGGLVIQSPLRMHSGEMPWETVIVDAYAADEQTRSVSTLYEDDGISPNYQDTSYSKTKLQMNCSSDVVTLSIPAIEGSYVATDFKRNWVVRLHCEAGQTPQKLAVNGREIKLQKSTSMEKQAISAVLIPATDNLVMPFSGQGTAQGPKGGAIVEVSLPSQPVGKELQIELTRR